MDDAVPPQPAEDDSLPSVLIVDDDPEVVESVRYALESNGFSVSVARDGNQGLALAETKKPDLLVLDMMMPKRSGFLVLEQHVGILTLYL